MPTRRAWYTKFLPNSRRPNARKLSSTNFQVHSRNGGEHNPLTNLRCRSHEKQLIHCSHFDWKLYSRDSVWYADGRNKTHNAGRHSLGTRDLKKAKKVLPQLDVKKAQDLGIIPGAILQPDRRGLLSLSEGRRLYEIHINRPLVTGGLQPSTFKAYRSYLDKLIPFFGSQRVVAWNHVTAQLLSEFATYLKKGGAADSGIESYSDKSVSNHLIFAKQLIKWFIAAGHAHDMQPIELKVRKAESQRPYCWRPTEVAAMVEHCRSIAGLEWMGNVIVSLACTGLRISELAGLRWSDVDFDESMLRLTDETNIAGRSRQYRRLKSARSRSFPIHRQLLEILLRRPQQSATVFLGPRGGHLKPDTVRRSLIRDVLAPLAARFPNPNGQLRFSDGRLHSFRHYFCSVCANDGVPEQMLMAWLGHRDSEMVRHYYHLHDDVACQKMNSIDFLGGGADGPHPTAE